MTNFTAAERVNSELRHMQTAMAEQMHAYQAFLAAAQGYDWAAAERCQLRVSSLVDAAMDSFMAACRLQEDMAQGRG